MVDLARRLLGIGRYGGSVSTDDPGYWTESRGGGGSLGRMILTALNTATASTGRRVTSEDSLTIPALYRGLFLLASIPAFLPLKVFERNDSGGADVAREHQAFRLLYHQPNPWQTSFQWRVAMGMSLHLRGDAYSALIWNQQGELERIHWLHPDRVEVYVDDDGYPVYRVWMTPSKTNPEDSIWLSRHEMHHFWVETLNGYTGCTAIEKCRETIALALGQREVAENLMKNGAMPSGILTLPPNITPKAEAAAKTSWKEAHTGLGKARGTAVLKADVQYKQLSLSMEDAQWIESSKFSKEEMATMLGLPPDFLAISSGQMGGVTGVEQRFLMSLAMRFDPILVAWEHALQRDLFLPEELDLVYPRFNRNAMLRTDILTRYRVYAISRQWGLKSADECRALEDENPIGGAAGEGYLSPQNMTNLTASDPTEWIDREDALEASAPVAQISGDVSGCNLPVSFNVHPLLIQTLTRVYRRAVQDYPKAKRRDEIHVWSAEQLTYAGEQLAPIFQLGTALQDSAFTCLTPGEAEHADGDDASFFARREAARMLNLPPPKRVK